MTTEQTALEKPAAPRTTRKLRRDARFVLAVSRALHVAGCPAHRVEEITALLATDLGMRADVYCTPTAIFVAVSRHDARATYLLRVSPGEVDLERQVEVDKIVQALWANELSADEAEEKLAAVDDAPPRYGRMARIAAYFGGSAAAALLISGSPADIACAGILGVIVGSLVLVAGDRPTLGRIVEVLCALFATLGAYAAGALSDRVSPVVALIAGVIVLLPGLTFTVAMTELAMRNLVAGTARLMDAVMTFLKLGFGVAVGTIIAERLIAAPLIAPVPPPTFWQKPIAVLVAGISLGVLLSARPRDLKWAIAAMAVAVAGTYLGRLGAGGHVGAFGAAQLGAFGGALLVGVLSNVRSRIHGRPAAITMVPGVIILVPGSIGFRSVSAFLQADVVPAVTTAFSVLMIAVSLACGMLLANFVVEPRRGL